MSSPDVQRTPHTPPKLRQGSGAGAATKAKDTAGDMPKKLQQAGNTAESQSQKQGLDSNAASGLSNKADKVAGTAKDTAGGASKPDKKSGLSDKASGAAGTAKDAADSVTGKGGKGSDLSDTANDASDTAQDTANGAGRQIQTETVETAHPETVKNTVTSLADLDGLHVSEGGMLKNPAGLDVGRVVEGDPRDLEGYGPNEKGEILDDEGDLVGRVEVIPQDIQGTNNKANDAIPRDAQEPVNKAKDGIPHDAQESVNKANGVPQDAQEPVNKAKAVPQGAKEAVGKTKDTITNLVDLQGIPVGEGGNIIDKAGREVGKVVEGNPQDLIGYAPNDKGEILDDDGDLIGAVQLNTEMPDPTKGATESLPQDVVDGVEETAEDKAKEGTNNLPDLPALSTLEGLSCSKLGKIVGAGGKPVGELIEGDAKKIAKFGATLDANGRFWDNRGNVIGKAQTLGNQHENEDEEPPFAGLEGLHVVEDGWVEDEQGMRVGKIVEGDAGRILGRYVDEDGEVTDRNGSVIARAEYYRQPEEPEPEAVDMTPLNGLTCNKMGFVIGPEGIPVARIAEGIPKELSGKKIDDGQIWDGRNPIGRVEFIPEEEREKKPEGPFAGLEGLVVNKDGFVEDSGGSVVGQLIEGNAKTLRGREVDEEGDIIDKFGSIKGHAEPYEPPEEPEVEQDLSSLEGKVVNKTGNVVDAQGSVFGRVTPFDKGLVGRKVDRFGQIWGDTGEVIGNAELIPGAEQQKAEGPFYGFSNAEVGKDGVVTAGDGIIGRLIEGDSKKLQGRGVDEDGHILDKNGNTIGRAERWEPEEKPRNVNPMAGRKVNREGEVRDADGNLIGKLTSGNLGSLIGREVDDNGFVVDNDSNKIGECVLTENIQEEPAQSEEELQSQKDRELAKKMSAILGQALDKVRPICKTITDHIQRAERTPKDELDEEALVKNVKPLLEEGGQVLQESNATLRALDPDGQIEATAKARAASHEATPEEHALADRVKELTETVVTTIDNGKRMIADMPHAKEEINPLWSLLSQPLFQIVAAVGLLLNGVLSLVGRLLDGLGLGGLVNGLLGGLGLDKVLGNIGLSLGGK